jgi:hypothetical protein
VEKHMEPNNNNNSLNTTNLLLPLMKRRSTFRKWLVNFSGTAEGLMAQSSSDDDENIKQLLNLSTIFVGSFCQWNLTSTSHSGNSTTWLPRNANTPRTHMWKNIWSQTTTTIRWIRQICSCRWWREEAHSESDW